MTRIAFAAITCLWLAGCATVTRQAFPQRYTLQVALPATRAKVAPSRAATLTIARVAAPAWLQGAGMHYRLQYRHTDVVAAYADSMWAAPPAQMLAWVLRTRLADSGAWRAVVGADAGATTTYRLQVRLDDFVQVFTQPQQSHGLLDATVTLIDGARVIAQTRIRLVAPAPSPDAAGGVAALNAAGAEFATRVQAWLQSMRD